MMRILFTFIFTFIVLLPGVGAQTAPNISLVGIWNEESIYSVDVYGSLAYVGNDNAMHILDISDPANPAAIATLSRSWEIEDIIVINDYAYVAAGDSGLRIIDVSNPSAPNEVGKFEMFEFTYGLDVAGNYAYVANGYSGLRIINIGNPTAPVEASNWYMQGEARGVKVRNNIAYVALYFSGLSIVDVSDPAAPEPLGNYFAGISAQDLILNANEAWVAAGANGLRIVDVSVPATPVLADSFPAANSLQSLKIAGNFAYLADGENGFRVLDISGSQLNQFAFYETRGFAKRVDVVNHLIYVADSAQGLFILRLASRALFSKTEIDYNAVQLNASKSDTLMITNQSGAEMIIDSTRIAGVNAAEFAIVSGSGTSVINPQDSAGIAILFSPQDIGIRNAALIIHSNAITSPDTFILRGTGALPPQSKLQFSATAMDFDSVRIGSVGRDTVDVTNESIIDLRIDSTVIIGTHGQDFYIASGGGISTTPPEESRRIVINFVPQASGLRTAGLVIFSNAETSPDTLALTGVGLEASFIVETDSTASAGDSLTVSFRPPDNYNANIARLYYRESRKSEYVYIDLISTEGVYKGSIPPAYLSLRGVEYYIYLSDGESVITWPADDPENNPIQVPVEIARYQPSITITRSVYRMISIPLILDEPGILPVLRDDYGVYDPLQWRVLRWQPGASRYAEFSEIDHTLTPGTAFWLINRSPITFDVENGSSVSSKSNYTLTLVSGWNQIGNPFAFPIDWSSIQLPANVDPPVYYDGKEYIYEVDLFQPWEGYFIYNGNQGAVNLIIPPVESTGASPKAHDAFDPDSEYRLHITGYVSALGLMDTKNYIGFRSNATGAKDACDHLEAPPIGHYLQISTDEKGRSYASNYKSSKGKGEHWDLDVRMSDMVDATVDIDLVEEGTLDEGFGVYVLDADHRCAIPVENGSFEVRLTKDRPHRRFRVIIGSADYAAEENDGIPLTPVGYRLRQNYPNPFNPETWISFQLAKRDHTTLKIYNIIGQEIVSLVDGMRETGVHTVRWQGSDGDGRPVPSGVYLYVLTSGEYSAVRKLLLIR